jgi:addiction module RelE/StbE family toxin
VTPVVWSPEAERDLQSIRDYIAHDSQRYAELVVRRIIAGVERLSIFPESGRVVPELDTPTIREVIVDIFRVVYRYRGDLVEIATVFRGSRAFPQDLT